MKTLISSEATPTPVGPYSPALSVDGWTIYEQQFPGTKPVRTMVRADLVADMLVEITAVARA